MSCSRLICALSLAASLVLAGCSTPDSRIAKSQSAFAGYPADVQAKIRAGQVEPGFTPEMVQLALGEPLRKTTRQTEAGDAEVWIYPERSPRFSFGLGVSSGGGHSGFGAGVGLSTGGYESDEGMRVEFRDGKVSAIEVRKK